MVDAIYRWFDDRLNLSGGARSALNKIFPDHWSFMLGEIALYSFVILVATGIFLTLYFVPSAHDTVYMGSYGPLRGLKVSEAYASTINLSFSVRTGLLMRQMHHWAANIFVGAIVVHMCRVYFTGAFRRPRELNWIIGVNLLILAIFNGFLGYSLPDDLVSGTGIRIAFSILESVPVVGSYLATFIFGGNFPGTAIIPRFFIIHVLILPAIIAGLLGAHLFLIVKNKHTQFKSRYATEHNVVGSPMWPGFLAKTNGFLFLVAGVTALLGALVQINPIWLYGPYIPYHVSYAVQPDWYMGWLDGALRVMPSWEIVFPGHMIPNAFYPAVLMPGITFTVLILWPFIEQKITGDTLEHNLLAKPRDRPKHTALGAAVLAFYLVLFGASATDVLANYLSLSLNIVLVSFRALIFLIPIIVYGITYKICLELQATPGGGKRKQHNIVFRSAEGGYSTVPTEVRPGEEEVELTPFPVDQPELVSAMAAPSIRGTYTPPAVPAGAAAVAARSGRRSHGGALGEAGIGTSASEAGIGTDGDERALSGAGGDGSASDGASDGVAAGDGTGADRETGGGTRAAGQGIFRIPRTYR